MQGTKWVAAAALCGLVLTVMANQARANTWSVTLSSHASGSNEYRYMVTTTPDSVLLKDDWFAIYDFAGLTGYSMTLDESYFDVTTPNTWANPPAPPLFDSSAIPNIVFKFNKDWSRQAGAVVFWVTLTSKYTEETNGWFTGQDHHWDGGILKPSYATGELTVAAGPAVPLPAAVWAGLSLLGLLGAARLRKALR